MTVLERTEIDECHRILSDAGFPGHEWTLSQRIQWLVDQDNHRLEMLVNSILLRNQLRERIAMLETEQNQHEEEVAA